MACRRIYETVGVRYDDLAKVNVIVNAVREMLNTHPEIDTERVLIVNLNEFSESSVDIMIYTYTKTTEWVAFHHVKQDVMLKVADIIAQSGGEIAFPTTTVHLPDQPRESRGD